MEEIGSIGTRQLSSKSEKNTAAGSQQMPASGCQPVGRGSQYCASLQGTLFHTRHIYHSTHSNKVSRGVLAKELSHYKQLCCGEGRLPSELTYAAFMALVCLCPDQFVIGRKCRWKSISAQNQAWLSREVARRESLPQLRSLSWDTEATWDVSDLSTGT